MRISIITPVFNGADYIAKCFAHVSAQSVEDSRPGIQSLNLAGKTSVGELIECIRRCNIVLSQETAALHIATANAASNERVCFPEKRPWPSILEIAPSWLLALWFKTRWHPEWFWQAFVPGPSRLARWVLRNPSRYAKAKMPPAI